MDDSLRSKDGGADGGWHVDGVDKECVLIIPAKLLEEIKSRIEDNGDNIPSVWGNSVSLTYDAPYNWEDYQDCYDALDKEGLLDFDLNIELP